MQVILIKDVDKIGKANTVVKVKDGFARNFLMPKGLAIEVTPGNLKNIEQAKKNLSFEFEKKKGIAEEIKTRLNSFSLTISALVQAEENLYGSITSVEICKALKDEGFDIEKTSIVLDNPIKVLGIYEIPIKLHPEVEAKLKIWVVKK
jgi:large subunit ribosomal protein L9